MPRALPADAYDWSAVDGLAAAVPEDWPDWSMEGMGDGLGWSVPGWKTVKKGAKAVGKGVAKVAKVTGKGVAKGAKAVAKPVGKVATSALKVGANAAARSVGLGPVFTEGGGEAPPAPKPAIPPVVLYGGIGLAAVGAVMLIRRGSKGGRRASA